MTNEEYSKLALGTAPDTNLSNRILLGALGLTGEAGEVAELVKKHVFHDHLLDRSKLIRELGDVLWYLNFLAVKVADVSLATVMEVNITKLAARYPEGHFSAERSMNRAVNDE